MQIEEKDIGRLAQEIRRFLGKADIMTRLSTMATLYLEFADVGAMHHAHQSILRAIPAGMTAINGAPYEYIDDHTIRLEPVAGITIVLSSKQRFAHPTRGSVGYRDIAFRSVELPKKG